MKLAAAIPFGLLVLPCVAQSQSISELQDNPLAADLPLFVQPSATGSTHSASFVRSTDSRFLDDWESLPINL